MFFSLYLGALVVMPPWTRHSEDRLPTGRWIDQPPPPSEDAAERRAHERIQVLLEVDYRSEDTFLFAYITDISAMGIFIQTQQPEPPGTRLELRFTPPGDEEPIECAGEVVWINPPRDGQSRNPGMGIQLVDLLPEHRDRIVELVRTIAYLDESTRPENAQ